AVERLREFFIKRGVTVGTGGLVVVISANAAQAAPAGLSVTICTTAFAGTTIAATKIIAMTTLQKVAVSAVLAATLVTAFILTRRPDPATSPIAMSVLETNPPAVGATRSNYAFW